jgi:hypothetical protein
VVLYGCETWSLTLRKEQRLKVFENGAGKNIWMEDRSDRRLKKTAYEEIHNLYSSPNIIRMFKSRRMRWIGHVAQMWEKRNAYSGGKA